MKGLLQRTPCAVSQEMVDLVANLYPSEFKTSEGVIMVEKVLFALGFNINNSMYKGGYYRVPDVLVRDNSNPMMVYKTKCVYNGEVRTTVKSVTPDGHEVFNDNRYDFVRLYERYEVLQPKDLINLVSEEEFINILDIGCKDYYDKGFLAMSRPPTLCSRNIVRN